MKLYGTPSSPYTRKVRVLALEKRLALDFRHTDPRDESAGVPELNPLGKIPVFERPDGSTLIDSALICAWLDGLNDSPRLLPTVGPERYDVLEWQSLTDGILDAAILVRMEGLRAAERQSEGWVERQQRKVHRSLAHLDARLGSKARCVGQALTLADLALGCCIGYLEFRFVNTDWRAPYANLGRLTAELEQRGSFVATPMGG